LLFNIYDTYTYGTSNINLRFARVIREICVHPTIDPSATLRTPVRAGPNGADRVLGDKERRLTEIFLDFVRHFV
jgi:hypothetical protein